MVCRFCKVPLVDPLVRKLASKLYPDVVQWGTSEVDHSGFKALWLQFDHIVPNGRGGETTLENMVITCAPCNYGRMDYTLAEAGLLDPRAVPPPKLPEEFHDWDGLISFIR